MFSSNFLEVRGLCRRVSSALRTMRPCCAQASLDAHNGFSGFGFRVKGGGGVLGLLGVRRKAA